MVQSYICLWVLQVCGLIHLSIVVAQGRSLHTIHHASFRLVSTIDSWHLRPPKNVLQSSALVSWHVFSEKKLGVVTKVYKVYVTTSSINVKRIEAIGLYHSPGIASRTWVAARQYTWHKIDVFFPLYIAIQIYQVANLLLSLSNSLRCGVHSEMNVPRVSQCPPFSWSFPTSASPTGRQRDRKFVSRY